MKLLKVKGIRCKSCNPHVVLYSRSRHDFRWCPEKHVAVDGGCGPESYFKISFNDDAVFEEVDIELPLTPKQLYDDWNAGTDKYGLFIDDSKVVISD